MKPAIHQNLGYSFLKFAFSRAGVFKIYSSNNLFEILKPTFLWKKNQKLCCSHQRLNNWFFRASMVAESGSLEEQLEAMKLKSKEVKERKVRKYLWFCVAYF